MLESFTLHSLTEGFHSLNCSPLIFSLGIVKRANHATARENCALSRDLVILKKVPTNTEVFLRGL